jgi:hypothetical protein
MPTTTNFGWTTPADTDLVKDGAAAIRTLGNGIDTSMAELKGGTTGQVLSKTSNTDMDFTWVTQDDANAIQNALLTTTGDIIYASAASTPARLGIGSSGQYLTVSSGIPSWGSVSAFPPRNVPTGKNLVMRTPSVVADNITVSANVNHYSPVFLPTGTINRLTVRTASSFSGTATVRIGIYNNSSALPSTVLLDAGTVSCTAASTNYSITVSQAVTAGYYWLVMKADTAATTNNFQGGNGLNPYLGYQQDTIDSTANYMINGYTESDTGAFSTSTTTTDQVGIAWVWARIA